MKNVYTNIFFKGLKTWPVSLFSNKEPKKESKTHTYVLRKDNMPLAKPNLVSNNHVNLTLIIREDGEKKKHN